MNFSKGDLVSFSRYGKMNKGIITSVGSKVSMYIEDRPYRIIDTRMCSVLSEGTLKTIYDYQIEEILSSKENKNV